ncbi:Cell division protein DivIB [uncultured bacterium]|nr:Cell division protein DivIB [uncultured bacterium]
MKMKPFKTKKRNRRHREPLGPRAVRGAKKIGKVLAFTIPLPALAFGAWWAYGQVTTSKYLVVTDVTVAGAQRVAPEELVAASGIVQGQNIFSFSKDEVLARLKANPWLESIEINRELPGSIEITVKERDAIALVKLDSLYVMDSNGVIFKRYSAEEGLDLPVVTGLTKESLASATENLEERLMELISVLTNRSGFNITNVSEIKIDADHGLSLFTLDEGVRLDVGMGSFEEKLVSFEKILGTRDGVLKGIEAFDLNNHREVIVRFTTDVVKEGGEGDGKKG